MRLQFLMCGEANDAFFSQAAMFRLFLDRHGGDHAAAKVTLCLGSRPLEALPARWRRPLQNIDLRWIERERGKGEDDLAQSMLTYESIERDADVAIICDADTMLLRPLPEDFLDAAYALPALSGCIAHFAPTLNDDRGPQPRPVESAERLWQILAERLLGEPIETPYAYTLRRDGEVPGSCPFYINLGFLAATPDVFHRFHAEHREVIAVVREVLDNKFYEQISVPFAAARAGLRHRTLPMRFNFPNDPVAEAMYPEEAASIILIHYLRKEHFDRHRIFAGPVAFASFMNMELTGSNAVFQSVVREATGGDYPF